MFLPFALLVLAATASASSLSKLECPGSIETELSHDLNEFFLGVWYDVYVWADFRKSKLNCYSFEIVQTSPEEVQAIKGKCEGIDLGFDWDNAHLKIVSLDYPEGPVRLLSNAPGDAQLVILQTCDFVSEVVIYRIPDSNQTAVSVGQNGAELLVRESPEQEEIDCLVHSIDVVQHYPWGIDVCTRSQTRQNLDKKNGFGF